MAELCVYALTPRRPGRICARGITGETLRAVHIGRFDVIVGRVRAIPKPTERNLRRYDRTMSALWRGSSGLLPARFGTVARDAAELEAMIGPREQTLWRNLRAVRQRAQMTVRIVDRRDSGAVDRGSVRGTASFDPTSPTRGRQYMRARQRERDVAAFVSFRKAVRSWIRDERVEKRGRVASIYHLIPAGSVERYRTAIERAAGGLDVAMLVTGPWPPYAFAGAW